MFRLPVEINFLAHQLVSPVFARSLYEYSVFAGGRRLALAVLTIPFERVFADGRVALETEPVRPVVPAIPRMRLARDQAFKSGSQRGF